MLADFHSHTTYSDGTLTFEGLVEAAERRGYEVLAITDHARPGGDHREVAGTVRDEVERLSPATSVRLLAGVELTDYDPPLIDRVAHDVREAGAQVVVVHGECLVANVAPGTNAAAVRSRHVDVLGHPGTLSASDASAAARHGVYIELSASLSACYANGGLYQAARKGQAPIVVNSDSHDEAGLLSPQKVEYIILGTGAPRTFMPTITESMAATLLQRALGQR